MKKHFKKNLNMSKEEKEQFKSSNTCWICEKLIDDDDGKVRDHCHITGKFKGSAHSSCNIFALDKLDSHISAKDYLMCKKIWNEFNMKNMGDYKGHYLKKDVLLLADIFEKLMNICLNFKLEKIFNTDIYLFIEKRTKRRTLLHS